MAREEFLERYAAMRPGIKAERIEGTVFVMAGAGAAAAVSAEFHGQPHAHLVGWLVTYEAATPGLVSADNSTTLLDVGNDPQPDASLRILPTHGGRTKLNADGYIEGAPELLAEITASSASYDLGSKLNAYRRNGVREYIVWRTYDGQIDWFALRSGGYEKLVADAEGIVRSEAFPGLRLKVDAMIAGGLAQVLAVLQRGIASEEHAQFVKKLEAAAAAQARK
jgi:Uma2 family endonuclease